MKRLCLATAVFILVTSPGSMQAALSDPTKPRQLYQLGEHALAQGDPTLALEYWRQALTAYDQLQDQTGIRLTLIAQTRAAHQLDHYRDACETLLRAFVQNTDRSLCIPEVPDDLADTQGLIHTLQAQEHGAEGLLSLGTSLEHLGKYESGIAVLEALLKSEQLSANHSKIALSLANLYHTQFLYARNRYQIGDHLQALTLIQTAGIKSFQGYQALFGVAQPDVALAAKVNSFLLAADLAQWASREVAGVIPEIARIQTVQPDLKGLLTELKAADFTALLPGVELQCRLRFANGLRRLIQAQALPESDLEVAHTQANLALKTANTLQLPRVESEAAGLLGSIYIQNDRQKDAFQAFDYARSKALSIRADDLAFQWEWQQARLELDRNHALALLASALSHADQVRANLFSGTTDRLISFQTEIAPIYRDYLELLLKQSKPDLQQVIAVHDRLQLAELETFLQCGRLPAVPINKLPTSAQPVTFHILDLGTHIEIIVSSKNLSLHRFSIPADNVKLNAKNLRDLILDSRFKLLPPQAFLPLSQALFQALIAPAVNAGLLHSNDTLLFQTDHFLSNIPLAILHDGNHYLVENYSISNRLSPFIAQPTKITQKSVNSLLLGLSTQSPSTSRLHFSPLHGVSEELKLVANSTHSTKILLNQNFTLEAFNHAITNSNAPIIHISTHGQFSSDSTQTFLLAWDQPILFKQIDVLFRSRPRILDLLFLSACQTAQGDNNSILGLAGMTVRAGASSTIASVWLVNADSTTELVNHFYHALTSGQSRADSLRSAQLSLINSQQFAHPYFWAPFMLIGNWL